MRAGRALRNKYRVVGGFAKTMLESKASLLKFMSEGHPKDALARGAVSDRLKANKNKSQR